MFAQSIFSIEEFVRGEDYVVVDITADQKNERLSLLNCILSEAQKIYATEKPILLQFNKFIKLEEVRRDDAGFNYSFKVRALLKNGAEQSGFVGLNLITEETLFHFMPQDE